MSFTTSFDIYMKWKLDYTVFILRNHFFSRSLWISSNSEKHSPDFNHTEATLEFLWSLISDKVTLVSLIKSPACYHKLSLLIPKKLKAIRQNSVSCVCFPKWLRDIFRNYNHQCMGLYLQRSDMSRFFRKNKSIKSHGLQEKNFVGHPMLNIAKN